MQIGSGVLMMRTIKMAVLFGKPCKYTVQPHSCFMQDALVSCGVRDSRWLLAADYGIDLACQSTVKPRLTKTALPGRRS